MKETLSFKANEIVGTLSNPFILTTKTTTSVNENLNIASNSITAYPNPFTNNLSITYKISQTEDVKISIYNQIGMLISTVVDNQVNKGVYTIQLDEKTTKLKSGVYFVKMESTNYSEVIKVVKIK